VFVGDLNGSPFATISNFQINNEPRVQSCISGSMIKYNLFAGINYTSNSHTQIYRLERLEQLLFTKIGTDLLMI
jgi:hypothetical protein